MNRFPASITPFLVLLFVFVLLAIPFHHQPRSPSTPIQKIRPVLVANHPKQVENELPNVFVMAPRDVRRPLTLAEEAIAESNFAEAVTLLGSVLIGGGSEDYFLPPSEGTSALTSVKNRALEMVGNLPARGRDIYQLRFGIEADSMLNDAVAEHDIEGISQVAQRYFHTEAGYEAMVLLGRHHLDQGRFLQAARCFGRTRDATNVRHPLYEESSILTAVSLVLAGRPEQAKSALRQLAIDSPRSQIEANGLRISLRLDSGSAAEVDAMFDDFMAMIGSLPPSANTDTLREWCLYGGTSERNAVGAGGVPLLKPLWRVPVNDASDEDAVAQLARQFTEDKLAAVPSVHPLAINEFVIMRTPNKVIGVDLRSGKRKWLYPWDDDFFGIDPAESTSAIVGANARQQQLKQRLWEDLIYGRMTSNGKTLYFVDGLGYATSTRVNRVQDPGALGFGGQARVRAFSSRETNHLVALDLVDENGQAIEGKLSWRVGDLDGLDEPALAGIFFLGPPLPLDGRLYVLAEIKGEIQLVVLNEQTGELEWSQQLAVVEEVGDIQLSGLRRLAGAVPSFGEGVLLCPTAAGAVVAVDPATRSLLWAYQFPMRNRAAGSSLSSNSFQSETLKPGEKWSDGSIMIADGHVLLTPIESQSMFCLDLKTGDLIWEEALAREDSIGLAGVRDGVAILLGSNALRAIQLRDAETIWSLNLATEGRPSGHGFMDDDSFYFPTVDQQLLEVNVESGEVTQRVPCERVLGNLISVKGRIVSHGYDFVTTYYQDAAAREEAELLLAQDENDPRGLALRGQIHLLDDRWEDAVAALARCYDLDPTNENGELLITCLLKGLRDDESNALAQIAPFEELLLASNSRSEFLRLQVERLVESSSYIDAFDHLLALLFDGPDDGMIFSLERIDREGRFVRQDRWVQSTMDRIIEYASSDDLAAIRMRLNDLEQQLVANRAIDSLQRYQQMFSTVQPSAQGELLLAMHAFEFETDLIAATKFHRLEQHPDPAIAAAANAGLAQCYARIGFSRAAAEHLTRLATEFADVECWEGQTGAELVSILSQEVPELAEYDRQSTWADGEVTIEEGGDFIGATVFPLEYFRIHPIQSDHNGQMPIRVDHDRKNEALLRDRHGQTLASIPLRQTSSSLPYYGSTVLTSTFMRKDELMILVSGYDIVAVDLTQLQDGPAAAVLWRHSLLPDLLIDPSNRTNKQRVSKKGFVGPLGWTVQFAVDTSFQRLGATSPIHEKGICYLKRNQLICVDPISGETLWKRSDLAHGGDVFGNDQWIAVVDRNYAQSRVFRLSDGEQVGIIDLESGRNALAKFETSLLSFDSNGTEIRLRLVDVIDGEAHWDQTFDVGTRAASVDDQTFAILEPDGTLTLRSLADGAIVLETALEPDERIQSFRVERHPDQLLVFTNHNGSTINSVTLTRDGGTKITVPNQMGELVQGNIYAIDPEMGQLLWSGAPWIEHFCLPHRQTYDVPVLPLIRHHPARTERGSVAKNHTEIAVIDLRDGRLLLHRDDIPQTTRMMHLKGDLSAQRATLTIDEKTFSFDFSDQPRESAPPADTAFEPPSDDE